MNKKILIGSIIAIAVLIGVSFTSVVGYRSVASDVKASPLFNIRTSRAIDVESHDFSCEYVGKGIQTLITIPKRDSRTILIQKFIDDIRLMDETKFNKLADIIIKEIIKNDNFEEDDISKLMLVLNSFRDSKSQIIYNNPTPFELTVNPIFCIFFFLFYQLSVLIYLIGLTFFAIIYYILTGERLTSDCVPTMVLPC